MRVLIACERSGVMRRAFAALAHDVCLPATSRDRDWSRGCLAAKGQLQ